MASLVAAPSARALVARTLRADARLWALMLGGLALIARLPLIFNDYATSSTGDTAGYVTIADELLAGNGFVTDVYRTAGYPLFIAPLDLLPGSTVDAVAFAQHMLGVALVGVVFVVADRYFGRPPALLAGFLTALGSPMMLVEHYVMPDFLFGVLVLAGTVALVEAAVPRTPSIPALALSGALFGLAAHVKPIGQVLIAVAPFALAFATRSWRETLRGSAVAVGVMVLVVAPWVVHNAIKYGHPVVSATGGQALWQRVFDQDKLPIPTDSADGRFAKRKYDQYIENPPSGYQEPGPGVATETHSYVVNALMRRGESLYEAANIERGLALKAIRAHPGEYLRGTLRNVKEYAALNLNFGYAESMARTHVAHAASPVPRALATTAWDLAQALSRLVTVLSLALLAIPALLFVGPRRAQVAAAAFIVVCGAIAVGGSLTAFVLPRYAAQIAPLQWILEAAAAVLVVSGIVKLVRRRRSTPATGI